MTSGPLQRSVREIASAHPEVEFALVLARTIDSVAADPQQLRSAVYELARQKLQQLAHDDPLEKERLMQALEVAIEGVGVPPLANLLIGGTSPASRNVISGNTESGIGGFNIADSLVEGNYIGTARSGMTPLGNGSYGVVLGFSSRVTIGGGTAGAGTR